VFQGTRLKNNKRAAQARWEQAKVQYERSVTNAFVEVANALDRVPEARRHRARSSLTLWTRIAKAVRVSNSRYLSGLSDYLEVLAGAAAALPAEQALAQTRYRALASLVDLVPRPRRRLAGGSACVVSRC
jgi:outer membrane protein TolC